MKIILHLLLLLYSVNTIAQDYRLFDWHTPHMYTDGFYIHGIRIDSVKAIGNDSVFYSYPMIDETHVDSNGCINAFGPSWAGRKFIVRSDSLNIILNYDGDSIYFHPLDTLGSMWIIFTESANHFYKATISSIYPQQINGVIDTVKEISIMEYLNGVPNPAGFFNNKKLKLSRQHGLIQLFDFINFPDYPELYAMNDSLFLTAKVVFFI